MEGLGVGEAAGEVGVAHGLAVLSVGGGVAEGSDQVVDGASAIEE